MIGTIQERFESKFAKSDGCWEWVASKNQDGYGRFNVAGIIHCAHRVSYRLYVGEIQNGLLVCHRCDNPSCVNPDHLFLGTNADNSHDCENKGRRIHPFGEKHSSSKLTEAQVIETRKKYSKGASQSNLAKEFGVSRSAICHIVCGHTWATRPRDK